MARILCELENPILRVGLMKVSRAEAMELQSKPVKSMGYFICDRCYLEQQISHCSRQKILQTSKHFTVHENKLFTLLYTEIFSQLLVATYYFRVFL